MILKIACHFYFLIKIKNLFNLEEDWILIAYLDMRVLFVPFAHIIQISPLIKSQKAFVLNVLLFF